MTRSNLSRVTRSANQSTADSNSDMMNEPENMMGESEEARTTVPAMINPDSDEANRASPQNVSSAYERRVQPVVDASNSTDRVPPQERIIPSEDGLFSNSVAHPPPPNPPVHSPNSTSSSRVGSPSSGLGLMTQVVHTPEDHDVQILSTVSKPLSIRHSYFSVEVLTAQTKALVLRLASEQKVQLESIMIRVIDLTGCSSQQLEISQLNDLVSMLLRLRSFFANLTLIPLPENDKVRVGEWDAYCLKQHGTWETELKNARLQDDLIRITLARPDFPELKKYDFEKSLARVAIFLETNPSLDSILKFKILRIKLLLFDSSTRDEIDKILEYEALKSWALQKHITLKPCHEYLYEYLNMRTGSVDLEALFTKLSTLKATLAKFSMDEVFNILYLNKVKVLYAQRFMAQYATNFDEYLKLEPQRFVELLVQFVQKNSSTLQNDHSQQSSHSLNTLDIFHKGYNKNTNSQADTTRYGSAKAATPDNISIRKVPMLTKEQILSCITFDDKGKPLKVDNGKRFGKAPAYGYLYDYTEADRRRYLHKGCVVCRSDGHNVDECTKVKNEILRLSKDSNLSSISIEVSSAISLNSAPVNTKTIISESTESPAMTPDTNQTGWLIQASEQTSKFLEYVKMVEQLHGNKITIRVTPAKSYFEEYPQNSLDTPAASLFPHIKAWIRLAESNLFIDQCGELLLDAQHHLVIHANNFVTDLRSDSFMSSDDILVTLVNGVYVYYYFGWAGLDVAEYTLGDYHTKLLHQGTSRTVPTEKYFKYIKSLNPTVIPIDMHEVAATRIPPEFFIGMRSSFDRQANRSKLVQELNTNCSLPGFIERLLSGSSPSSSCSDNNKKRRIDYLEPALSSVNEVKQDSAQRVYIVMMINQKPVRVLLDSGASSSFIDRNFCQQLGIKIKGKNETVKLALRSIEVKADETEPVLLSYNQLQVSTSLKVLNIAHHEHDLILGIDLWKHFNIFIAGLKGIDFQANPNLDIQTGGITKVDEEAQKAILDRLEPVIAENIAKGGCCTHPDALVQLVIREDLKHTLNRRYPQPHLDKEVIKKTVDKWFKQGKISLAPCNLPYNNPIVLANKTDKHGNVTGKRVCLDFKAVNAATDPNSLDKFPGINIQKQLQNLGTHKFFAEIDVEEAYLQIRMEEESKKFTAFEFDNQQYIFNFAPFGLTAMSSLFQRIMSKIFFNCPFVFVYIDNILIFSNTLEEHESHIRTAIQILTDHGFRIQPSKLIICGEEAQCLGHIITKDGVRTDPAKVEKVANFPRPTTIKEVESFLGLCNYLASHIRYFAEISSPLQSLKHKKGKLNWSDECESSFRTLKQAILSAPLLSYPDMNGNFVIMCDASTTGIGGVLFQPETIDGPIQSNNVIEIFSRKLKPSETRYSPYKLELLALVSCLKKFHQFIKGRHITVYTDHKPLTFLQTSSSLNNTLATWLDVLIQYQFQIIHKDGVANVVADALSRAYANSEWGIKEIHGQFEDVPLGCIEDDKSLVKSDNRTRSKYVNYQPDWSDSPELSAIDSYMYNTRSSSKKQVMDKLSALQEPERRYNTRQRNIDVSTSTITNKLNILSEEQDVANVPIAPTSGHSYNTRKKPSSLVSQSDSKSQNTEKLPGKNSRNITNSTMSPTIDSNDNAGTDISTTVVTINKNNIKDHIGSQLKTTTLTPEQRKEYINKLHSTAHGGVDAIVNSLIHEYQIIWPRMRKEVLEHIKLCKLCAEFNSIKKGFHPAKAITAAAPWKHIQFDLSGPYKGEFTQLLIISDVFTNFTILKPLKNKQTSSIAEALFEVFTLVGIPLIVQSDNEPTITSHLLKIFDTYLGVVRRFITPYNPRGDGKVERNIRTVSTILNKFIRNTDEHLWYKHVPSVQLAFNTSISSVTNSSPFSLMFGRPPSLTELGQSEESRPIPEQKLMFDSTDYESWSNHLSNLTSIVYPSIFNNILLKKEIQKEMQNKNKSIVSPFSPGDMVYTINPDRANKLQNIYNGPYLVKKQLDSGSYELLELDGRPFIRNVTSDRLKLYIKAAEVKDHLKSEMLYNVDRLSNHREVQGDLQYYVEWADKSPPTWESQKNINSKELIDKYWKSKHVQTDKSQA
jgi:hypothetical protein